MKSLIAVAVALVSTSAFAQSGVLINCAGCSPLQGLEVAVDGASVNTGNIQGTVRAEVSSGQHEIKVWIWSSPFERNDVAAGVFDFPKKTELRITAKLGNTPGSGKLEVYGKGRYEPAPQGPSQSAVNSAADLIAEASDYLKEVAEYNDDEDSSCQSKVAAKLEVIGDNLKELRGNVDPGLLRKTADKANDTQELIAASCPKRVQKALGKKMGKIVAKLDKATASLR